MGPKLSIPDSRPRKAVCKTPCESQANPKAPGVQCQYRHISNVEVIQKLTHDSVADLKGDDEARPSAGDMFDLHLERTCLVVSPESILHFDISHRVARGSQRS